MRKADYPSTADGWNMGFCQMLIVKDGSARPIGAKMKKNVNIYRALCEKDGKLCIAESKKKMTYETFVKSLSAYKVTHARLIRLMDRCTVCENRAADFYVIM